jgi:hypothetical protein
MKIGVVIEEGYPERLAEMQVKAIVGTNDYEIEEVGRLYEDVDEAISRLRESGCQRLEVLHPDDFNLQRFEGALITEYGRLFERGVETVPEGFYRLTEANPPPQQVGIGGTIQQTNPTPPVTVVVFPFNFPIGDMKPLTQFITDVTTAQKAGPVMVFDWCTGNSGPYVGSAYSTCMRNIVSLNKYSDTFKDVQDFTASSAGNEPGGILNIMQSHGAQVSQIICNGKAIWANGQQSPSQPALFGDQTGAQFKIIAEINKALKDGSVQKNQGAIDEFLRGKPGTSGKIKFISDLTISVQETLKYNPQAGQTSKEKGEAIKELMQTMGIMTDLQNVTTQMEKAGLGLVNRIGKYVADQAKKVKKEDEKKDAPAKIELLVSHPKFKQVFDALGGPELYVKNEEIEKYLSNKADKVEKDLGEQASTEKKQDVTGGKANV